MKGLALSVLVALVLMQTPLHQLTKLPALFNHYTSHIAENPNCSFFAFMAEHYGNATHHGDMNEEDQKLPFKVLEFTGNFVQAVLPVFNFHFPPTFQSAVVHRIPVKLSLIDAPGLDSPFQPPCF